jgi:5,10-methylene-tetrahydrofolate dehydrogenase/methenyl tetrahydrofolate cyclohydrolase
MKLGATITNCNINILNLKQTVCDSDIAIVSAGSPELVKADWIKLGPIVVDVGYHILENENLDGTKRIVGNVYSRTRHVASLMTPVPGGIGPMTVTMLIENTIDEFIPKRLYYRRLEIYCLATIFDHFSSLYYLLAHIPKNIKSSCYQNL